MNKKIRTQESGYVLFLAVIVSTIIVTLGTLIASFVRHDLALAGSAEQSDISFYAATAMMSCGRYHDANGKFVISASTASRTTNCFGINDTFTSSSNMVSGVTQYYDFSWETKSGQKICSVLQVTKTTIGGSAVTTRMIARGYNTACATLTTSDNVVERVIEYNF